MKRARVFPQTRQQSLALQNRFLSSDGLSTMSSAVVAKFQDHYEVLGIDPKADSETVQRAYTKLAQRYHSSNADTGDPEKFEAVNLAYEILSDPILRPEFDRVKGIPDDTGPPRFSGLEFFENLGRGTGLRTALLCVLYDRRRNKPFTPSLSMRQIENIVEGTPAELTFVLWFLKQRSFISSDDKSSLQITVIGMDFLEANPPDPKLVMRFIKLSGMVGSKGATDLAVARRKNKVRIAKGVREILGNQSIEAQSRHLPESARHPRLPRARHPRAPSPPELSN